MIDEKQAWFIDFLSFKIAKKIFETFFDSPVYHWHRRIDSVDGTHRLNMEVDLQSLFGLHVTWCAQLYSLAETLQPAPSPRIWAHKTRGVIGQLR